MAMKVMKEGRVEFTYRAESKSVEKAVVTFRPDLTLTLNESQLWNTNMMLKFLFSPEFEGRANVPPQFKELMEGTYQFRENAKRDPHRAKLMLDIIPGEMHTFSAAELEPIYQDIDKLTHRVASDMAMDLGLH